ncbi:unnamed protein product [Soboliphyme baturini]|uniref:U11/U12 small nuclear ribonucleoprotein 35 kDa protein n=1 Tax=Soboliphyme baturini TaxID=241478 RepID=A0A183IPN7_9BILA|nr:unnamed protein product [Soboliphyme baturini]
MSRRRERHRDIQKYDPVRAANITGIDDVIHDRAVLRALTSRYKLKGEVSRHSRKTLFVGRLNPETTESELREAFTEFGQIKYLRLVRDIVTGTSKRYAFVEYKHRSDLERAYQKAHLTMLKGYQIIVDYEAERTLAGWVPRRLGGGWGGRKQSGQMRFGCRCNPFRTPKKRLH